MDLAIIPARGGSKRIPRKNLREFCGKPIIAYSIEAAKLSGVFDHIIVSTDDAEIAALAKDYGAQAPFVRPRQLADDHTPTVPVVKHAIEWWRQHSGPVDAVCCIYATAPFVQASALRQAHELLLSRRPGGYVFSATTFPFPIQRAFRVGADGRVEMFAPENYLTRSQDLEEAYQDAGQFYWGAAATYLREEIFFSPNSLAYLLPRYMVQDIDTLEDWRRAELMYRALKENGDLS